VFAEFFHVNDADGNLAHLPEGMDFGAALMLCDMIPTGLHACELAQIEYGDTVCVIGIGPVGLMAVQRCSTERRVSNFRRRDPSKLYRCGKELRCDRYYQL